jgi:hypothetical protein
MPACVALRSSFNRCLSFRIDDDYIKSSPNRCLKAANDWIGIADDGIFKLGKHSATLGQHIAKLHGNADAEKRCEEVAGGFGAGQDAVSAVRFIPAIHKMGTGQCFWQTNSNGWRKVAYGNDGKPVVIRHEELNVTWEKVWEADGSRYWRHKTDHWISRDGKYIDDSRECYTHNCIPRAWDDIAMDVLVFVARLITPLRWLHSLKAIDLGKHAKTLGDIVMAIWGLVLTIAFVQSIRDLINEADVREMHQKIWNALQSFFEWVALPFDFGVGAARPEFAIVGAILNILAGGSMLIKEAYYF